MNFKDSLDKALADLVRQATGRDVTEIRRWEEEERSSGGCETCAWDYTVVDIYYWYNYKSEVLPGVYTYEGEFSGLLRELTND